jgi:hypothetical protein
VQTTHILGDRTAPGYWERHEQRTEPGIIEAFADVFPGRHQDAVLVGGNAREALGHTPQFSSPHPSSKNDDMFHVLGQSSRQFVEVLVAFRQHQW